MRHLTLILLLLAGLSACGPREDQLLELQPSYFNVHRVDAEQGFGIGQPTGDLTVLGDREANARDWDAAGGLGSVGALIGYSTEFREQSGSSFPVPGFSQSWRWTIHEAKMFFDLTGLPSDAIVSGAVLLFRAPDEKWPGPVVGPIGDRFSPACRLKVSRSEVPLLAIPSMDDEQIPTRPAFPRNRYIGSSSSPMNISRTVFDWWSGARENLGLVVSPDPSLLFKRDTDARCALWMREPVLLVSYSVPVAP